MKARDICCKCLIASHRDRVRPGMICAWEQPGFQVSPAVPSLSCSVGVLTLAQPMSSREADTQCPESELPWRLDAKESTWQCRRRRVDPWIAKTPQSREWLPTPVLSPGEVHGQRSLAAVARVARLSD